MIACCELLSPLGHSSKCGFLSVGNKKGADILGASNNHFPVLSLADVDVSLIGVDDQVCGAVADRTCRGGGCATFLVDLDVAEVGGDVAFARSGVNLESGIRRQHQRHIALLAGDRHLAERQLVRGMHLDVAVARLQFQVAAHVFEMHFFRAHHQP